MIAKTFEVRDKATFIPVLAVKLNPECEKDRFLLARAGYGLSGADQRKYVLFCQINGGVGKVTCDPYHWRLGGSRTLFIAHQHIIDNFDKLESGAVVCVEFLSGKRKEPKKSEAGNF